jgi:hypothetical protein
VKILDEEMIAYADAARRIGAIKAMLAAKDETAGPTAIRDRNRARD